MKNYLENITNEMVIDSRFVVELARNENGGLMMAPHYQDGQPGLIVVYATTNADPVYVATLDAEGLLVHHNDETGYYVDADGTSHDWAGGCLAGQALSEFFQIDSESDDCISDLLEALQQSITDACAK